jgi:chemotaxis protein MotB
MARRKKFEIERENHDRWLVSYADFITLLFAFFVVMYAISSVNQGKYKVLTTSLGTAFGTSQEGDGTGSRTAAPNQANPNPDTRKGYSLIKPFPQIHRRTSKWQQQREDMIAMATALSAQLEAQISAGKLQVIQNNRGIRIDIASHLLFAPGSAELQPDAELVLQDIVSPLSTVGLYLQVEGHTDNQPIHTAQFYSNWELSAVRASSVVRLLVQMGIAESRLSAVGYGESQPMDSNESESGRAKNRRVSIMVLFDAPESVNDGRKIKPR